MRAGTVVRAELPRRSPPGREQTGARPCVVVSDPETVARARYPVLMVVPLTTARGPWVSAGGSLYPLLPDGAGGLNGEGVALLDQVLSLDVSRIALRIGTLTGAELEPIRAGLRALLRL